MLHANLDLHRQFQETLSESDRQRLDEDLTAFAKESVAGRLLRESPESLRRLLSERPDFSASLPVGFSRTRTQPAEGGG